MSGSGTAGDVSLCGACGFEQRQDVAVICGQCAGRLAGRLRGVAELLRLLDETLARQDRMERVPGRSQGDEGRTLDARYAEVVAVTSLPMNEAAADAARDVRGAVQRFTGALAGALASRVGVAPPRVGNPARAAAWLADHVPALRAQVWAALAVEEIGQAVARGWQVVDRPAETWYAGPCDAPLDDLGMVVRCGWELYAPLGASTVKCRGCGTVHDVAQRRAVLLAAAGDIRVTASLGARALTSGEWEVTAAAIRGWKHRGLVVEASVNAKGQPEYLLGDLVTVSNRLRYGLTATPRSA